jgi:hypothetical protein
MMKLALPLMLAWYFARNEGALRLRDFAVGASWSRFPCCSLRASPTWAPQRSLQPPAHTSSISPGSAGA